MAENDEPTPGPEESAPAPAEETVEQTAVTPAAPATPATPALPKFTDRVWNFRAMVAVALAALLLGGGIGAAIAAVSHDDDRDRYPGYMRWQDGPGGPGPFMGPGPNGFGPGDRKQFRKDLRDMRQKMREQMKKQLQDDKEAPTPTTPPTPSPSSNG